MCVALIAFSEQFSYLSHDVIENGSAFNETGKCVHLIELYKKILQKKRDNPSFNQFYLATVSSETFIFERKWWSENAIKLDEHINRFIEDCLSLGINVIRLPHFRSEFCALNSQNGDFYTRDGSYAIKTNIKDLSQIQWLFSNATIKEVPQKDEIAPNWIQSSKKEIPNCEDIIEQFHRK